ncbi:MAG: hypothetical protein ABR593_02140 [Candidatus Limnocylindria bacterium]
MSAFLARLAARAVGQVPVAQPRLSSLYEASSEPEESQHGLEVIDDKVAVGPESPVTPASADSRGGDATSRAVSPAPASRTAAEAIRDPGMQRTEPAESRQRQDATGRPGTRRPRTVVADQAAPDERVLASDPAPVPQTSPIVPAVPLSAATPVPRRSPNDAIRSATPSAPEPPAVRVHIGRLEIRANLPEAAPVRPPARQVREEAATGVSLADYLRGAR